MILLGVNIYHEALKTLWETGLDEWVSVQGKRNFKDHVSGKKKKKKNSI